MDLEGLVAHEEHEGSEHFDADGEGASVRAARTTSGSRREKRRAKSCAVVATALLGIGFLSRGQSDLFATGSLSSIQSLASYDAQCMHNEELFEGLCYKTCSELTSGSLNIRQGTDSCCKSKHWFVCLFPFASDSSLALGIGGGTGLLARPHAPGIGFSCARDEEIWMTVCYRKCSILSNGTLPTRTGADTCCSEATPGDCLEGGKQVKTKSSFAFSTGAHPPGFNKDSPGATNPVVFEKKGNDDGLCETNEEAYKAMCYATCASLTNSTHIYRAGPASCCKSKYSLLCAWPANVKSSDKFNVGGHGQPPHIPGLGGTCLKDEEVFLGACYHKCSIMAGQDYPIRTGVAQCCNSDDKCLISASFDVGGAETGNFVLPGGGSATTA